MDTNKIVKMFLTGEYQLEAIAKLEKSSTSEISKLITDWLRNNSAYDINLMTKEDFDPPKMPEITDVESHITYQEPTKSDDEIVIWANNFLNKYKFR